jgi:monomeric isocitrate dehydrogenase
MDTPQIDDIIIVSGQISAAIIAIAGAGAIFYRAFFKKICDQLDKINQELHPNGGSSMRDAINRIEKAQEEIKEDSKNIREKVDDHIQWHLDN